MPSFYRQSIQNAVNQQINIGKSKHRTTLNREAIGQVVSYCAVAAAHDLWDWGEKESTLLTLKMNNAVDTFEYSCRYCCGRIRCGVRVV